MWQEKIKCEANENENTTYKLFWAIAKATVPGKMFLAVNAYVRNKWSLQINNLSFHLMKLGGKEQNKTNTNRKKMEW